MPESLAELELIQMLATMRLGPNEAYTVSTGRSMIGDWADTVRAAA